MNFRSIVNRAAGGCLAAGLCGTAVATDITLYSTGGQPSPELYRSAPGNAEAVPGYAHVRTRRDVNAEDGEFSLAGWPEALEPGSLVLEPDTGEMIAELEWLQPERDAAALLAGYRAREIVVEQSRGTSVDTFRGRLLSAGPPLVLAQDDGAVRVFDSWQGLRFPEAAERVTSDSRVRGRLNESRTGELKLDVGYLTGGLTWWLDYHATIAGEGQCRMDLSGRAVMVNRSGADYPDANIHLVAGAPNRARAGSDGRAQYRMKAEAMAAPAAFDSAEQVAEYYRYSLDRPVDLADGTTVQRPLFAPVTDIPCARERVMDNTRGMGWYGGVRSDRGFAAGAAGDIAVYLRFDNTESDGLGRPLPAGGIQVASRDGDGGVTFIGEDTLERIPAGREGRIRIGAAFDLMGERTQTDYRYDERQRLIEESFEIELTNGGGDAATVVVLESLARAANWEILKSSHDFEKVQSDRIRFAVDVASKGATTLTYTVRYSW